MAARKDESGQTSGEKSMCGMCKKNVGKNDKGVMCEMCEVWFHSRCQNVHEETYKLLNQDRIHFYCEACDRIAGKILKSMTELVRRQDRIEEKMVKVEQELKEIGGKVEHELKELGGKMKGQEKVEEQIIKVEQELKEIGCKVDHELKVIGGKVKQQDVFDNEWRKMREELRQLREKKGGSNQEEEEFVKLQKDVCEMRTEIESKVNSSVKSVKEDFEETLEIERRKNNIVIHGVTEEDAEKDVEEVADIFASGLCLDFVRHVDKVVRIGRYVDGKKRPVRLTLKSFESRKEILTRAKQLKDIEKFKRMFITPDLTRKQQEIDRELRSQLRRIREEGETGAKIKFGKIVKNLGAGREMVLFQLNQTK